MAGLGPWNGLRAEIEHVWWHLSLLTDRYQPDARLDKIDRRGLRAGLRGRWLSGSKAFWFRGHRLRLERGFNPLYAALSYDGNREGWRFAGGIQLLDAARGGRERLALSVFHRIVEELEEAELPGAGRLKESVSSLSITGRPLPALLAGLHFVHTATEYPAAGVPDESSNGYSIDLRWEGVATVDPILRIDAIRREDGAQDARTVWQGYLSVRVVK
jgi:hypothetical protein